LCLQLTGWSSGCQQLLCRFSAEDSGADTVAHTEERDTVEDRHGEDNDGVADFFEEVLVVIHCAYSLQERRRMRQQLLHRFFRFLESVYTVESKYRANPPNFQKFFDLLVSRCGGGRFSSISNPFYPISFNSSIYMTYDI